MIWDQRGRARFWAGNTVPGRLGEFACGYKTEPDLQPVPLLLVVSQGWAKEANMQKCSLVITESRFDDLENLIRDQWVVVWTEMATGPVELGWFWQQEHEKILPQSGLKQNPWQLSEEMENILLSESKWFAKKSLWWHKGKDFALDWLAI